jgi:hypothetical protein
MIEFLLWLVVEVVLWAALILPGHLFARYVLRIDKEELARDDQGCALAGMSMIFWLLVAGVVWMALLWAGLA